MPNFKFRKPSDQMFIFFLNKLNKEVPVSLEKSFFVGDAAGG